MDGVATTHSSHSVSLNLVSPYDSQIWHCLHVQVTLREGQGLNPLPDYPWTGPIITDMFSKTEDLTEAFVLVPGKAVLFSGRWPWGEGLSYEEAWDAVFQLSGNVTWIWRPAVVEVVTAMVQAAVENCGETRGWGHLCLHHVTLQLFRLARGHNVLVFWVGGKSSQPRRTQSGMTVALPMWVVDHTNNMDPEESDGHSVEDHPHCLWIGVLIVIRIQCCPDTWLFQAFPVTLTDLSEPNSSSQARRRPHVKIYLPVFKDEQLKDAVTYCTWQWDVGHSQEIRVWRIISYCTRTDLYRVFLVNWLKVWAKMLPCRRYWGCWMNTTEWWWCSILWTRNCNAPSRLSRGHGQVSCTACRACLDHPNWVSQMHQRWASGEGDAWPFLQRPWGVVPHNAGSQDGRWDGYLCWIA